MHEMLENPEENAEEAQDMIAEDYEHWGQCFSEGGKNVVRWT